MKQNEGLTDKIVRYVLAAVFIVFGIIFSYWWFIPAVIALATAIIGWCGLYSVCGINTNSTKKPKKK